jgi:hypothetical protein
MLKSLFLAAAMLVGLSSSLSAQGVGPCVIQSVEGSAVVSAPGAGRHVAEVGLAMGTNATLRTMTNARVTLLCPDNLRVVVGPSTEIAVLGFKFQVQRLI